MSYCAQSWPGCGRSVLVRARWAPPDGTKDMTVLHLHGEAKQPEGILAREAFDPVGYYQRALQRQTGREIGLRQDLADKNVHSAKKTSCSGIRKI